MEDCQCENDLQQNTLIIIGFFCVISFVLSVYNAIILHKRVNT